MTEALVPRGRGGPARRGLLVPMFAAFLLARGALASAPGGAGEPSEEPAAAHLVLDLTAAHSSGDFGTGEPTRIDQLTARLRWLFSRFELKLSLPYLWLSSTGNIAIIGGVPGPTHGHGGSPPAPAAGAAARAAVLPSASSVSGPGDALVEGDLDLIRGTRTRPWLTAMVKVKLPTADDGKGLGTGRTDVEGGLDLAQPIGRTDILLGAGYTSVGRPPGLQLDDVVRFDAGLQRRLGDRSEGAVFAYVESRSSPVPGLQDRRDVVLGGSARFGARERLRFMGAAYLGLTRTAEDWGLALTVGRSF